MDTLEVEAVPGPVEIAKAGESAGEQEAGQAGVTQLVVGQA